MAPQSWNQPITKISQFSRSYIDILYCLMYIFLRVSVNLQLSKVRGLFCGTERLFIREIAKLKKLSNCSILQEIRQGDIQDREHLIHW